MTAAAEKVAPGGQKQAIVAGAGPAGCVAAMFLARQGYAVTVLEKRGDPTAADVKKATFVILLSVRGISTLRELGVQLPDDGGWVNGLAPAKGQFIHLPVGGTQAVPGAEGCILVERAALAKHLLLEARRLFPAIDFQFDIYIVGYDLHSQSATLQHKDGSTSNAQQLNYDLLVAADGASSQVRQAVAAYLPGFAVSRRYSQREYVVAHDLPAAPDVEPKDDPVKMPGIWLHYFAGEPPVTGETPPGLAAYAQEDGTYSACVILQKGRPPPTELAAWRAVLQDALQHSVPQEWIEIVAKQTTVSVLDKVLIANEANSMACALSEYNRIRKPEADALAHMDSISSKWWSGSVISIDVNWPRLETWANLAVSGTLHTLLPFLWAPPVMKGSFHQHAMDYTEIVRCRRRDTAILITAVAVGSVLGITAAVRLLITGWPHISG